MIPPDIPIVWWIEIVAKRPLVAEMADA
jgi:hypothetical protein